MIEPFDEDIGRKVSYKLPALKQHALGGYKGANEFAEETGIITKVTKQVVWVLLYGSKKPVPFKRNELYWKETVRQFLERQQCTRQS